MGSGERACPDLVKLSTNCREQGPAVSFLGFVGWFVLQSLSAAFQLGWGRPLLWDS